jgi:DNA-binding transcriptional regulator YiaG
MLQQPDLELLSRAERITLAIKAIKSNVLLSQRRAAAVYNVPETTL